MVRGRRLGCLEYNVVVLGYVAMRVYSSDDAVLVDYKE